VQPKIYTVDEHRILPEKIDSHAFYVIEKLREAGHSAYLVGGGVRDLLLGQKPKDFDVSTSASPEEIRALFRNAILIGRRFRLAHIRFGQKIIEVATFRAGDTEAPDLIVRDNVWGSEEEDVLRRDFTINGLFYNPREQTVIDYVQGYPDLEQRVLRTIGQPDLRFIQDPVRMIRLIKFCARFQFEIDPPTHEALLNCKEEIIKSSPARILEELLRMLESGSSQPFFHLLHEYGLLRSLLPAVSRYIAEDPSQVMMQLLQEIDAKIREEEHTPDRSVLLAALLFPMLHSHLLQQIEKTGHIPHLGQIAEQAETLMDRVFSPFFKLPRKMLGAASFILASQYRFVPLDGRLRNPKAVGDPFFSHALDLFKIRCALEPDLLPYYEKWSELSYSTHEGEMESNGPRPKRRRRRRRT
jgi:poly(A) polymerase